MATQVITSAPIGALHFPAAEIRRCLSIELQKIADEAAVLRPEWEPLLDSRRVVGTVLAIENMLPSCKIPPDKVIRKGGYNSVGDAVEDIAGRIERLLTQRSQPKVRR
jgi:hypothetical protein